VEKHGRAMQATDDSIMLHRKGWVCKLGSLDKNTDTHSDYVILLAFQL